MAVSLWTMRTTLQQLSHVPRLLPRHSPPPMVRGFSVFVPSLPTTVLTQDGKVAGMPTLEEAMRQLDMEHYDESDDEDAGTLGRVLGGNTVCVDSGRVPCAASLNNTPFLNSQQCTTMRQMTPTSHCLEQKTVMRRTCKSNLTTYSFLLLKTKTM